MLSSTVFRVLVVAFATVIVNVCSGENTLMTPEDRFMLRSEDVPVQQMRSALDRITESSEDRRIGLCKHSCIQKCLENRKRQKASDDSSNPSNDSYLPFSHQTEKSDGQKQTEEKQFPQSTYEQCLAGCQEACSFYKRLLTGKSSTEEHETLSETDNSLGNGHTTKSSFVTGDSDISLQTSQKSATSSSSPVSSFTSSTTSTTSATTHDQFQNVNNEQSYPVTDSSHTDKELDNEPFELRVASLIHQKSLVITELKWNDIGGNPNQAYLVTWELTDGGLKGHLVTDSSSVTLSLWPNSVYQIQIQQFQPMFDSDGSEPAENTALKSLPLIVDTNEASFPLGRSSPLFSSSNEEENAYNVEDHSLYDEYAHEMDEEEEHENESHKQEEKVHSMTSLLALSVCATVLVLVLLSFAAFAWIHVQSLKKVECFSCCFTSGEEPKLLSHEDLSDVLCTTGDTMPRTEKSLKFYMMPSLFGSNKEYKVSGFLESDSPAQYPSVFQCSLNNGWSSSYDILVSPSEKPTVEKLVSISESVSANEGQR